MKKTKLNLSGNQDIQIPIGFTPQEIQEYKCVLVVKMNEQISWRYPIRGVTECSNNEAEYNIKTECRVAVTQQIQINLMGLPQSMDETEFQLDLQKIPDEFQSLLKNHLKLTPVVSKISSASQPLIYNLKFSPQRPVKCEVDLVVFRQSGGGRWKFNLMIEATEPPVQQTIHINSQVNKTSSISFNLKHKSVHHKQKYTATMSNDSAAEFSVLPQQGEFDPLVRHNNFIVSFCPIEYGKAKHGKIIIQTEDYFWSFAIVGSLPAYKPPQHVESKVDNKLQSQTLIQLKSIKPSTNFLLKNLQTSQIIKPKRNNNNRSISPDSNFL